MQDEPKLQGVIQLMVRDKLLEKSKALEYASLASTTKQTVIQYIVKNQIIPEKTIACFLGEKFGAPIFDLNAIDIKRLPTEGINDILIRKHHFLPLFKKANQLYIAIEDPSKEAALKDIQFSTNLKICCVVAESEKLSTKIHTLIRQMEGTNENGNLSEEKELAKLKIATDDNNLLDSGNDVLGEKKDAPIVKFINKILVEAMNKHVSDIHFEPYEHQYRIRYRLDGVLIEVAAPPIALASRMTARIKILSNLDISERRIPQDGRFHIKNAENREVECRVSICPTTHGEKVVLRLLDPSAINLDVNALGLDDIQKETFLKAIGRPQGLIIVTGPTGSGKSITLYNALNVLNTDEVNICSVEDPVEIRMAGVNQVNINPKAGLTFATTLRAFLRQDPDVIMVGEIRDLETAEIAIAAAQTGHLVLSTLHTNNAAESLTRLKNMGIPSYNIISSLNLLIAQRLVRCLCHHCKTIREDINPVSLIELGFTKEEANTIKLYKPEGCFQCTNGYKGRVGLFELLSITREIEDLVISGATAPEISRVAMQQGMKSIHQSGLEKIKQGITTLEELNRVVTE